MFKCFWNGVFHELSLRIISKSELPPDSKAYLHRSSPFSTDMVSLGLIRRLPFDVLQPSYFTDNSSL